MLNKEIFIKRNIDPPSPLLHRVDKRLPHLLSSPRFHNNSLSWDLQHLSAPFTHSFSLSVSLFSAPQTPSCVGQIHGRHQKLYLQNVSWLKRISSPAYFFPCLPPPPTEAVISAPPVRTFSVFNLSAVIISSLSASLLESSVCKSDL